MTFSPWIAIATFVAGLIGLGAAATWDRESKFGVGAIMVCGWDRHRGRQPGRPTGDPDRPDGRHVHPRRSGPGRRWPVGRSRLVNSSPSRSVLTSQSRSSWTAPVRPAETAGESGRADLAHVAAIPFQPRGVGPQATGSLDFAFGTLASTSRHSCSPRWKADDEGETSWEPKTRPRTRCKTSKARRKRPSARSPATRTSKTKATPTKPRLRSRTSARR